MAVLPAFFLLFHLSNRVSSYTLREDNGLIWPSEYYFKGEEINLIKYTLFKPFEIWYSSSINRSRCDYYGGTDQEYYYADEGYILNVHPVTDKNLESMIACNGKYTEEPLQDLLPDTSNFFYTDTIMFDDKEVKVWKSKENYEDDIRIQTTMYVTRNKNEEDIPVRMERKEYNLLKGSLTSHDITNYYSYMDKFAEHELNYKDLENCLFSGSEESSELLNPEDLLELDTAFERYTKHHKKSYNGNEHNTRKMIFEKKLRKVQEVNNQNLGYKLTLNEFSDWTEEELKYLTGTKPTDLRNVQALLFPHTLEEIDQLAEELPESFDLRMEGVISSVKHQGHCGSCWAFATTAAVEGAIARTNGGKLVDLSEQSLVDCAWGYENVGCDGGFEDDAFKYVADYGLPTEQEYGDYKAQDGPCNVLNMNSTYKIRGFALVTPQHPNALKLALVKYGPVTASIHASDDYFMQYSSGVFYDFTCEGEGANHAVTVVGYGVRDGAEYWIVKNSYGEDWGEDGYILMANKNNNCYLLNTPFYPIV